MCWVIRRICRRPSRPGRVSRRGPAAVPTTRAVWTPWRPGWLPLRNVWRSWSRPPDTPKVPVWGTFAGGVAAVKGLANALPWGALGTAFGDAQALLQALGTAFG